MKINKKELYDALDIVKPGLSNKELLEQTTSFVFRKGRVVTYNDEISMSCPIKGLEELEGAILAENLYKFLAKVKDEEMDLKVSKNEVVLTIGRAKAGLTFVGDIVLPLEEELRERSRYTKLPEDFCKAVSFVMTAAGTNLNEPILTCVHVSSNGYAEASDGWRIARHHILGELPILDMIIPAKSIAEAIKINPTRVSKGRGWVHFRNKDGVEISCRILNEDTYVDIQTFLEVKGANIILPDTLGEVLSRASVFAKRDTVLEEEIHISIEDKTLVMEAMSNSGWFSESVEMPKPIDTPKSITIPPHLLREILKETQACIISKNRIKFEGQQWQYISQLKYSKKGKK